MNKSIIETPDTLKSSFNEANEGLSDIGIFMIKVNSSEQFEVTKSSPLKASMAANFELVKSWLDKDAPSYIPLKLENKKWLLLVWVPEESPVRLRMINASAKAALRNALGSVYFNDELFMTQDDEVNEEFYNAKHDLTLREATKTEDEKMKAEESHAAKATTFQLAGMRTLDISFEHSVLDNCNTVKDKSNSFTVLKVDKELVTSEGVKAGDLSAISKGFADDDPCYVIANWQHKFEEQATSKIVFVYYCPDDANPKKKMVYSTVVSNIVNLMTHLEIPDVKRFECSLPKELTEEALHQALYPKKEKKEDFARPKVPGNRRKPGAVKAKVKKAADDVTSD